MRLFKSKNYSKFSSQGRIKPIDKLILTIEISGKV